MLADGAPLRQQGGAVARRDRLSRHVPLPRRGRGKARRASTDRLQPPLPASPPSGGEEIMKTEMASIALDKLNKHYGSLHHAVKDVDLEIADKEFVALVGPSGCGKSTTLRMIAGLEDISSGEIRIGDTRGQPPAAARPRRRHGVPELRALSAHERLRQSRLRPAQQEGARERDQGGDRPRRRDPGPARADEAQAAPALGRPAAARGARPLHRAQSAGLPVRRAALQPRRQAARPDAHRDQAPACPGADHVGLRHPRPGRGDDPGRPRRGDARRPGPAGRHAARRSTPSRSTASSRASSARRR